MARAFLMFTAQTARLRLDALQPDDWRIAHGEWGDPDVARMMASIKPNWSEAETKAWLAGRLEPGPEGFGRAIRLLDGTLIGSVGIGGSPFDLGYFLGKRHWGKGYATEAVGCFLTNTFAMLPDLDQVNAEVFDDNPASAGVLQKLGFAYVRPSDCTSLARVEPAANSLYRVERSTLNAPTLEDMT